jgi:ribosomal protein L17
MKKVKLICNLQNHMMENTRFKLWYTRKKQSRNSISILIDKSLKNEVVAVRRQEDRIIMIKLVFKDLILNVISTYAPTSRFER